MEKFNLIRTEDPKSYLEQYRVTLDEALRTIRASALSDAASLLACSSTIYVCGNGGSLATAEHFACDVGKGAGLRVVPLTSGPILTAFANDVGYDSVFDEQFKLQRPGPLDCLVALSASGNSPNVVRVARTARAYGVSVLGLTGFTGGALKELSDVSLHLPVSNYGQAEDGHSILMHAIAQFLVAQC